MIFGVGRSVCQLGILLCVKRRVRMMWKGVGSMGGSLFTDKLVFGWLEVLGVWSLDSATRVTLMLATTLGTRSTVMETGCQRR